MKKSSFIIILTILSVIILVYIFHKPNYSTYELEQIEDVEKEIRKINHIVEDREIYVELARIEKNPQNLETCKYNIERLTNDYIFLKKIIDRKINYLRDQGINYKFTGIISIDK